MSRSASNKIQPTDGEIKSALRGHYGVRGYAAHSLGISRRTLHRRIINSPDLVEAEQDIAETIMDRTLWAVKLSILEKRKVKDAKWWLDQFGKDRGFGLQPSKIETASSAVHTDLRGSLNAVLDECEVRLTRSRV